MPAYRSSAEAEIREPVVARLRVLMPGARIIHEIQSACQGPNRIDVLAVTPNRIAAVEIKSSRDKLDRLPAQIKAMQGCAHHVIAALHAKFLTVSQHGGRSWAAPDWGATVGAKVWGFGLPDDVSLDSPVMQHDLSERWDTHMRCPPVGAINMLWREELREIVCRHRLHGATSKLTMPELIDVIRWAMTGAEITSEVCASLRSRRCSEADPEIEGMV